jgi:hypothetical protein
MTSSIPIGSKYIWMNIDEVHEKMRRSSFKMKIEKKSDDSDTPLPCLNSFSCQYHPYRLIYFSIFCQPESILPTGRFSTNVRSPSNDEPRNPKT